MRFLSSVVCLMSLSVMGAPAFAGSPVLLGQFGHWIAYELEEEAGKACYMLSKPVTKEGKYKTRGEVYALLTHRPGENTQDEFSFMAGYAYKDKSPVSLKIDGTRFALLGGDDEAAFSPDAATDRAIAAALLRGSKLVIEGSSVRGTKTKDSFSLKGSGAAYKAINTACNVTK